MQHTHAPSSESIYFTQKLKRADEYKFNLRKVIYELDKLTYHKGTRAGDYLIREIIAGINEELRSYDNKLKICDFGTKAYTRLFEEILQFFEQRYLGTYFLSGMIVQLKQELINQNNADIQHNIDHQNENYKRNVNNPYREELKKDLIIFDTKLSNTITPLLNDFLYDVNCLLLIQRLNENIDEWSISHISGDAENIFKIHLNYFFNIHCKVVKKVLSVEEITTLAETLINESGVKTRLLRLKNNNETKFKNIIFNIAKEYLAGTGIEKNSFKNKVNEFISEQDKARQSIQDEFEFITGKLRILTDYKKTLNISGYTFAENLSGNRANRYPYYIADSGEIKLKEVADYLKDSLIFINEWLLMELKKNPKLLSSVKSLIDCLPAEIRFYDLFETANIMSARPDNRKKSIWGYVLSYITKELAAEIINIIEFLCVELKEAFIRIIFDVELNKSSVSKVFEKKVNIIYDSFENARKKIINILRQLDKI